MGCCGGGRRRSASIFSSGHHFPTRKSSDYRYDEYKENDHQLIEKELNKLYAAGIITAEKYNECTNRLRNGNFTLGDLQQLYWDIQTNSMPPNVTDVIVNQNQVVLEKKKTEIVKLKEENQNILSNLTNMAKEIQNKIEREEQAAENIIKTDEIAARSHIHKRQDFAEELAVLRGRIKEVQNNLDQLKDIEVKLEIKLSEYRVSQQRENIGKLEDILSNL